jgi:hypothetical protein
MCQRWETLYLASSQSPWGNRPLGGLLCATSRIRRSKLKALSYSKQCSRRKSTRASAGGVPCAVRLSVGRLLLRSNGDCFARNGADHARAPDRGPRTSLRGVSFCSTLTRRGRRSARTCQLSPCSSRLSGGISTANSHRTPAGDTARSELEQPPSVTIEATEDAAGRLREHVK